MEPHFIFLILIEIDPLLSPTENLERGGQAYAHVSNVEARMSEVRDHAVLYNKQ